MKAMRLSSTLKAKVDSAWFKSNGAEDTRDAGRIREKFLPRMEALEKSANPDVRLKLLLLKRIGEEFIMEAPKDFSCSP